MRINLPVPLKKPSMISSLSSQLQCICISYPWQDDEFVIYSTSQQRVKYVVLFTLPGDPPLRLIQTTPEEEENIEVMTSSVGKSSLSLF